MAYTPQEVANLYGQYLGGATPSQSDINFWTNYDSGGNNVQGFINSAQNDPRYNNSQTGQSGSGGSTPQAPAQPALTADQISGAVNSGMAGLGTQVGAGFDTTNQNLQTGFNQTNQNLSTGVNSINNNLQTGLGTVNTNLGNLNTNIGTGLTNLNKANDDRATAQTAQATDYYTKLAGLSGGLKDQLTGLGTTFNSNFGALNDANKGLQSGLDTANTGVNNLQQDFTRRSNAADQKRSDILDSVAGTAANNRQAMTQGFSQLGGQISGLGTPHGGAPGGGQPMAPQGGPTGSPQQGGQAPQQQNFLNTLNSAKQILAQGQNLNPATGMQLSEFVSAFDDQGQLIQQGPDNQGVMTFRQMDPSGNLQIAKQNQQGQFQLAGMLNIQQISQMIGGGQ